MSTLEITFFGLNTFSYTLDSLSITVFNQPSHEQITVEYNVGGDDVTAASDFVTNFNALPLSSLYTISRAVNVVTIESTTISETFALVLPGAENLSTFTFVYNNDTNVAPEITLNGEATIEVTQNSTYTDAGATAFDLEDGDLTSNIVVTGSVNTAVIGEYTLTYTVTDSGGLTDVKTRTVNVISSDTAPVITLIGDATITIRQDATYVELGATAFDAQDGDLTSSIVITGVVDTALAGSYEITYTVTNSLFLTAVVVRTVVVTEKRVSTDYSFLKLYTSKELALDENEFKDARLMYFTTMSLSPDEIYTQISNDDDGISFNNDYVATIVDACDKTMADITANVFVKDFIDANNTKQVAIEYNNLGVDYFGRAVFIKIVAVQSGKTYYTRPINITNKNIENTIRIDYWNSKNLETISYENALVKQSIRLKMEFKALLNNSEAGEYYQISTGRNISTRFLKKIGKTFSIENIDTFTYLRLQEVFRHDYIYLNKNRVSNNPILEAQDRIGQSNLFKSSFSAFFGENETYKTIAQITVGDTEDFLLLENSSYFLLEDGDRLILE